MSARVRTSRQRPARGGDGRRRVWSESKIPRVAVRRTRAVVAVPSGAAPIHAWEFAGWESETADFVIPDTGSWGPGDPAYYQGLYINYNEVYSLGADSIIMQVGDRTQNNGADLPEVFTMWVKADNLGGWYGNEKMFCLVADVTSFDRGLVIGASDTHLRFYYRWHNTAGFRAGYHFHEHDYSHGPLEIRWVTDRDNGTAVLDINGTEVYSGTPTLFWGAGGNSPQECEVFIDSLNGTVSHAAGPELFSVRFYAGDVPRSEIAA